MKLNNNINNQRIICNVKKYLTVISLFLGIILLSGCAMVTLSGKTPDNKKIYGIDCSGKLVSMSVCYEKAQTLCPHGYQVLSNDAPLPSQNITPFSPGLLSFYASQKLAESVPGVTKGIIVVCK